MEEDFFKKQTNSSRIKANIVAEYFPKYCKIILKSPQKEIRYLDLFAGPGIYDDNSYSTPILIGKACSEDPALSGVVQMLFNDNKYSEKLKENFNITFPNRTFAKEPRFGDKTVGEDERINSYLSQKAQGKNPYPTLLFFDPFGYKTIDTLTLAKFLEHWGNEIFLFVNIKRIHAAIENDKFDELMQSLFPSTINELRQSRKYKATVYQRLSLIMENLANEFKRATKGNLYHCAFKFQEEDSSATSHFIIHFTKHPRGYELVKQIYYNFDNIGATLENDGTYTYDAKKMETSTLAFSDTNVEILADLIESKFKGRTLSARKLFDEHHTTGVGDFCGSHYVKALRLLFDKGKLTSSFEDNVDHKVSVLLTETCILTFS